MALAVAGCGLLKSQEEKKAFGEACQKDADCQGGACAAIGGFCTKDCRLDKDCGDGQVCRAKDTGTGSQCSKPSGSKVGAACKKHEECDHGFCLKKSGAGDQDDGFCSRTCETPGDCPSELQLCQTLGDFGTSKMCITGDPANPEAAASKITIPKPSTGTVKPATSGSATPAASSSATSTPTAASSSPPTPIPDAGAPAPDAGRPGRTRITIGGT
jgi:hypothetical protein